ncbi:uncharacterized protein LOC128655915 [Bombina bombina]|uniref:uncharacterized protein LOC128655915 n=1 Tax=Bombina bombina TaxID=8345 RepID=UPI00235AAE91|nr:uncharacterized protein LOC128655915 [Bombina bombina]
MMWQHSALSTVLNLWLAISFGSGQSGDDILADLGSGFIIDTLRDQPKEPPTKDTTQCHLTFVTPSQEPCAGKDERSVIKEDVTYLQNLLKDTDRVLQSLKYTVNSDTQDSGYQEVISEHNKGIREDNKEFYEILNKMLQELNVNMDSDNTDIPDAKKKLRKSFHVMDHVLQTTSHLAEKLDKTSQDLDELLEKQLQRCSSLAYRNLVGS